MILSVDNNGGIGYKNGLPWPKLKEDLHWFKQLTEISII
jgi:dihydrofolate reductase